MFLGFDRHEILKRHYRSELPQKLIATDPYTPECADDVDDYYYLADYLGSSLSILPSGKIYAPWTTNQTRHDEQRDAAFIEALEELAEESGGSLDCFSGDWFFVTCHERPRAPAALLRVVEAARHDLYCGPLYLTKEGEECSMFDDDYHHAFDFQRAVQIIGDWFDEHPEANKEELLGRELARYI